MRVRYVCADRGVPVFGTKGASIHVRQMIRAFERKGAEVDVVAVRHGDGCTDDLPGISIAVLDVATHREPARNEQMMFESNSKMRDLLESLPVPDLVYERHALWSVAAMEWARERGIASVLEVNAPLVEEQATHRVLVDRGLAEHAASRAMQAAGAVAVVSRELIPVVARYGTQEQRIQVIPNGIDAARFPLVTRPRCVDAPFTVGFVGSLKPWHGLGVLAEAFALFRARCPRARLMVVGDGPERASFERLVAQLGVARDVEMIGAVEHDRIPMILESMDTVLIPYPPLDNFYFSPLKLFEAMASGLAVVASRIGQVAEVIEDGVTGILCTPGDVATFASGLAALECDPEGRARMGLAAREKVLREHTWDSNARRVLEIASRRSAPMATA